MILESTTNQITAGKNLIVGSLLVACICLVCIHHVLKKFGNIVDTSASRTDEELNQD